MLARFLETFVPDNSGWLTLSRFREAVFFEIDLDQLIEGLLDAMAADATGSPRQLFFYEAAFSLSYQAKDSHGAFARVYELANDRPDLAVIRTRRVSSEIPEGRLEMVDRGAWVGRGKPERLAQTAP